MFTLHNILEFEDPRLAPYRTMRAQFDHLSAGYFVAEGEKVVRRLLESPFPVRSVLVPPKWQDVYADLLAQRAEPIDLFVADKEVLQNLIGFSMYQGVLGLGEVPAPSSLESLLALPRPRLFAAIDGLSNAENVGAVVRNAAAIGAHALLVGDQCAHPYLRRAVRSSMGTIFKLPFHPTSSLPATLQFLRNHGVRCIAAHPHVDRRTLWDADFSGDCCIVLGAEGDGIRPEVLASCDEAVMIPMAECIDSLNVAAAAAVFFAEAARQRSRRG